MKYLIRYLSVLLSCLLLFLAFSVSVSAEDLDGYAVTILGKFKENNVESHNFEFGPFYPNNGVDENNTIHLTVDGTNGWSTFLEYTYQYNNNRVIISKDKTATIKFHNMYYSFFVDSTNKYARTIEDVYIGLLYDNGVWEYVREGVEFSQKGPQLGVSFTCTPSNDVAVIKVYVKGAETTFNGSSNVKTFLGEIIGDDRYQFSMEVESQEAGLLKSVIEWLKGIKNGISDLFDTVKNGISSLLNSIAELPSKIWSFIEEGLITLFIPDDDYISNYKDNWDELLSTRFGALYQSGGVVVDIVQTIYNYDQTDTINIPEVSLNSFGIPFSFGGYSVQVVPKGENWDDILNLLKASGCIIVTLLFVNGLRKRYDEVMGVEK